MTILLFVLAEVSPKTYVVQYTDRVAPGAPGGGAGPGPGTGGQRPHHGGEHHRSRQGAARGAPS